MWLKDDYFPLLYSRGKVEEATRQRTQLQPAGTAMHIISN